MSEALMERGTAMRLLTQLEEAGVVSPVALDLPEELTAEQFEQLCAYLGHLSHATRWWIGDLICWGEGRYKDRVAQASELFGLAEGTLQNYASVCDRVPAQRRRVGVPFHVHSLVARLEPAEQDKWLGQADEYGWTHRETRIAMEAANEAPAPAAQPAWSRSAEPSGAGAAEPSGGAAAAMSAPAQPLPELRLIDGGAPSYPAVLAQLRDSAGEMIERAKKDGLPTSAERWELERDALSWALEQLAPELA